MPAPTALSFTLIAACGSPGVADDPRPGTVDAATTTAPDAVPAANCRYDDTDSSFLYPDGPYGVGVGDVLAPFEYQDCDGATVRLVDVLSQAKVVLFNVATGWCPRCTTETSHIEADVHQAYCARGLRVVQVLTEDPQSNPAGASFCAAWRDRYGLTFPVLIDPGHTTDPYFDGGAQPLNVLVDHAGVIRYRSVSTVAQGLPAAIERVLAE